MKYYKIYSRACVSAKPVQDVTYKKDEVLNEAICYQYDYLFDSNGTSLLSMDEDVKRLYAATEEDDVAEQVFNVLYEKVADLLIKDFDETGKIDAGDWALVALDDDEDAWAHRANSW